MTVRIRLRPRARADIKEIHAYIAERAPNAARKWLNSINDRIDLIIYAPKGAQLRPELGPDYRAAVVGSYLIFYRLEGEEAVVIRVVDGRQDLQNL